MCSERRSFGKVSPARCTAAGSLRTALKRGFRIVSAEFGLHHEPVFQGETCLSLRQEYDKGCSLVENKVKDGNRRFRVRSALSSLKRCFDASCSCDAAAAREAKREWVKFMSQEPVGRLEADWCRDPLWEVETRVRKLTRGWGRFLGAAREGEFIDEFSYTPDQQGCLERVREHGGTLAVAWEEERNDAARVRVGTAKTKGKVRVVTMQSARVKRILSPLHNALYNHLSGKDWLVRGDVKKEHFRAVLADLRDGEWLISGDYENATNNIHSVVVRTIVSVLAEEENLSTEERECMLASFYELRWQFGTCVRAESGPINRGSMMGNLLSFPILCLLNKICYDIAADICYGSRAKRVGRFNGDDCMFSGTLQFFHCWRSVTSTFGLIVNEKKTSLSLRSLELNSNRYCALRDRIIDKPVLSFLKRKDDVPECILKDIIQGTKGMRRSVRLWIVCCLMRYEISVRKPSISDIPQSWRKTLIRRKWFRDALRRETPLRRVGEDKSVKTILGPPPRPKFYNFVTKCAAEIGSDTVSRWKGVVSHPLTKRCDRTSPAFPPRKLSPAFIKILPRRWMFLWPRELYEFVEGWDIFVTPRDQLRRWIDDHPLLHPVEEVVVEPYRRLNKGGRIEPPACILADTSIVHWSIQAGLSL